MKFVEKIEKIQKEESGYMNFVKNGIFFVAVGKDAIVSNKTLGLKLTCMKDGLCKVGFLVNNVEKYIKKLEYIGNSFVLYVINEKKEFEEIYRYEGKKIEETRNCIDCSKCENRKEEEKDILERVRNLGKTK